ncbi:formate--tetrahydrofolate ligase [Limosilactobacillus reuteri]|jgi:formate--tetrahydrofolate ligase|uniref:Formate--tetrahydrofolate ligase n=3 Tax=Limosilactobacillus reuteri TaxID=1598 RepID=A0A1V4FNS7_LIMRT|nr:formate--tetrahydrofolate ligase [Limosilactobacillus reuteri]CCC04074.1 formyltetrahydrofolate synthase [Limosilactobacillus reuteri subsp. suis]AGO00036.1 formyltetrahydrofolate synthase [Limosilactobacillus reuteri I5007]AMY13994.1 formate--tetrahydrofolate ligase [Limosilactobacillus reuteri]MCC4340155.1 formate--tetrahydrofolate ligase [Limosilactobacillus reuteri]MCC4345963.1 formate--tetrahydrofolate ligase [Limosilactobacillus reuteri]
MTDIEIADQATLEPITEIAEKLGLSEDEIEQYGKYKAKIDLNVKPLPDKKHKLILVTSINPTPAGEGKSTVLIGLGDALNQLNYQTTIAMREPSMGPVFGIKGGATGGGYSQVVPMEDINLNFTGDLHALTSANNTLAALIDNYIMRDNAMNLDPRRIIWKRVEDVNDRALRNVVTGLGGPMAGVPRETGFDITAASELMAILCLSTSLHDLKERISRIVVGYTYDKEPVTVGQLNFQDAITIILKDALKPNLVQTLDHTPTIVHGGPFANIAHGCNSVLATQTALNLSDYTVTEAGFGADLGGEKFLDIKQRVLGKHPDAIVIVATVRALEYNGGAKLADLNEENLDALKKGMANLNSHIKNMQLYGLPIVVAINHFVSDTDKEIQMIKDDCAKQNVEAILTDAWAKGGKGTHDLANKVVELADSPSEFTHIYDVQVDDLQTKLEKIAKQIYGAKEVSFSRKAQNQLKRFAKYGWNDLPVCIAKTQYSFTDDQKQLGAPTDFTFHIRELVPKIGAGFVVALAGNMMTMPGLPKEPAAVNMTIDDNGKITGLF